MEMMRELLLICFPWIRRRSMKRDCEPLNTGHCGDNKCMHPSLLLPECWQRVLNGYFSYPDPVNLAVITKADDSKYGIKGKGNCCY